MILTQFIGALIKGDIQVPTDLNFRTLFLHYICTNSHGIFTTS